MAQLASAAPAGTAAAQAYRRLAWAATFFTFAVLVHNFDHVRRAATGEDVASDVFWVGSLAVLLEVAVVVLWAQRHRFAVPLAALAGLGLAIGYVVVHFLPARGWLSDSFVSNPDTAAVSWIAGGLEIVAALVLATAGMARCAGPPPRGAARSARRCSSPSRW